MGGDMRDFQGHAARNGPLPQERPLFRTLPHVQENILRLWNPPVRASSGYGQWCTSRQCGHETWRPPLSPCI